MAGHSHSHDNIDWDEHLQRLRAADEFNAPELEELVDKLLNPGDRTVIEIGAGAGGTAAAFAAALSGADAELTIVDTAEQLLAAAGERAVEAAGETGADVAVHTVRADAADDALAGEITKAGATSRADLVYAAFVVHHLPDQLAGLRRLADLVRPGGRLAIVEFGLQTKVLPADIGIGEPGLEARLIAAREESFQQMRSDMEGCVRLPMGWNRALAEAGLADARSWSYLVDRPAPLDEAGHTAVLRRLELFRRHADERVSAEDLATLDALLDPSDEHYAGTREDLYYLSANTVHVATKPK